MTPELVVHITGISQGSIRWIDHTLIAIQFSKIGDLCRAYAQLDQWRARQYSVSFNLTPFVGVDNNEPDVYYLYIDLL